MPSARDSFYGMALSAKVEAAIDEGLTETKGRDLVDRHLVANFAYFGGIDKTLSGFVVLDDEGDDYTLADVRDSGQIFWQDHDERMVDLRFDSIDDYVGWKRDVKAAGPEADRDDLLEAWLTGKSKCRKKPTTPQLLDRYQWLVWLLAQPLMDRGKPMQTTRDLAETALGIFEATFETKSQVSRLFDKELPALATDPHLAIYWLLHTTMVSDAERRARVVATVKGTKNPLLAAFVERLGELDAEGELSVIPDFRMRRGLATLYAAYDGKKDRHDPEAALRALAAAGSLMPAARAVLEGLANGTLTDRHVAEGLRATKAPELATALVLATLERRAGKAHSLYADHVVALAARADWSTAAEALSAVHDLARDTGALAKVVSKLLEPDPLSATLLRVVASLRERTKKPILGSEQSFRERLELAEATAALLGRLKGTDATVKKVLASVSKTLAPVFARRVLQRLPIAEIPEPAVTWALERVLASKDADRFELAAAALPTMPLASAQLVVLRLAKTIDRPSHPLVDIFVDILGSTRKFRTDEAESEFSDLCEAILGAMRGHVHAPSIMSRLLSIIERDPPPEVASKVIIDELLNPFSKLCVVAKLDASTAVRAFDVLVKLCAADRKQAGGFVRGAAGHQLFRFRHPAITQRAIDALVRYGDLHAKEAPKDHFEDVVANLYEVVGMAKTPAARNALVERLFTEKREFWRMGNIFKSIISDDVHRQVLAELGRRKDTMAIVKYAYTCSAHLEKAPLVRSVTPLLLAATAPKAPQERSWFKAGLLVAQNAALVAKDFDTVRALEQKLASIAEKPLDLHIGKSFVNPFADKKRASELAAALSGKGAQQKQGAERRADTARARGEPNLKITDQALGLLAEVAVAHRILHDAKSGEVWFVDNEHGFHYFDGFAVVTPPFGVTPLYPKPVGKFLAKSKPSDDRALCWNEWDNHWREAIRFGDRMIVRSGLQNSLDPAAFGIRFDSPAACAKAMQAFRAWMPKGYRETNAWYLDGKGAIDRTYVLGRDTRVVTSAYDYETIVLGVEPAALEASIRKAIALEHDALAKKSGRLLELEWVKRKKLPLDMTLVDWMSARAVAYQGDVTAPVTAIKAMADALDAQKARPKALTVTLGKPASAADIAAFERARKTKLPAPLVALWKSIGSASWTVGNESRRLLGPKEVLARRAKVRAGGTDIRKQVGPAIVEQLDVLVETETGAPALYVQDAVSAGRVFTAADDVWWEKDLGWSLAYQLARPLVSALSAAFPDLTELWYGQEVHRGIQRVRLVKSGDRFWNVSFDPKTRVLASRHGKIGALGSVHVQRLPAEADGPAMVAKMVASQKKKGFAERK